MHDISLILTLTGGMAAALVCGYITFRLGLSPIVGYLVAGFCVGPNSPGFVANKGFADQFAEIGVILLMFGVGLQFHLKELLAVKRVAIPGAVGQSVVATILGTLVGVMAGWGWSAGIVFGLAISVASTVVLMRVLSDNGDLHTPAGHIAVGWLVVEDLFTVFVLVLLPALFAKDPGGPNLAVSVTMATIKVAVMVGLTFLAGRRVIPWILDRAAATRSRELFTLTVLVIALGIAVGSAKLFGVSMALGAFLAGMVVGRSDFSLRAATEALPMRDAFAVLFFVSVGILFDPRHLLESPLLVAGTLAVILIGKPLVAYWIVRALDYPNRVGLSVGVALAQIGEFSFILAAGGRELGILDDRANNTLIAASIVSIMLNPILYRLIGPIDRRLDRLKARRAGPAPQIDGQPTVDDDSEGERYRAIVVGHGPVGRTLVELLRANKFEPVVLELNVDTVRNLGARGIRAIYGDAVHYDTLVQAGLKDAVALILSSSMMQGTSEAIRLAREINPKILIFARTAYLREIPELKHAGADIVFSGEGEVALSMTELLLRQFGATEEQIDRERARVRDDLFGGATDTRTMPDDRGWPTTPHDEVQESAAEPSARE